MGEGMVAWRRFCDDLDRACTVKGLELKPLLEIKDLKLTVCEIDTCYYFSYFIFFFSSHDWIFLFFFLKRRGDPFMGFIYDE